MDKMDIPEYWTAEQAITVFEFLDELKEAILDRYQYQMIEYNHTERGHCIGCQFEPEEEVSQIDDKDIPF